MILNSRSITWCLLIKIFTDEVPLADVQRVAFTQLVAQGSLRPEKPSPDDGAPHLTDEIWAIAEQCWVHAPSERPLAKDICNSLEEMTNPCISDSTRPLSGTTSQIIGTPAPPEAGTSSGRDGSASIAQNKPVLPNDRAEILPVTSVHATRELAKEGERGNLLRSGRWLKTLNAFEDLVPEDPRGEADRMLISEDRKEDEVGEGSSYMKAIPYGSPSDRSNLVEVHNVSYALN